MDHLFGRNGQFCLWELNRLKIRTKFTQKGEKEMAYLQLLRLAGEPLPSITTSNASYDYFQKILTYSIDVTGTTVAVSYTLAMSDWVYGDGNSVTGFKTGTAGYSMCINGVLQQSSLYSVAASGITLIAPAGGSIHIPKNAPITLQTFDANTIVSTTVTFAVR
jgi:hypothetical protein